MYHSPAHCPHDAVRIESGTHSPQHIYDIVVDFPGMFRNKLKRRRASVDHGSGDVKAKADVPKKLPLPRRRRSKTPIAQDHHPATVADVKTMPDTDERCKAAAACLAENVRSKTDVLMYEEKRRKLLSYERSQAWDAPARSRASKTELRAQKILFAIREHERVDPRLYGNLPGEAIPDLTSRDMGGRFLANKPTIEKSKTFAIAKAMPKGCHLHLHFNSEIPPERLFEHAARLEDTMFVRSTRPLCCAEDFRRAEIVFTVLPKDTARADIFSGAYRPEPRNDAWMLWRDFRNRFPPNIDVGERPQGLVPAECWAREKMIITKESSYREDQTHNGAWACFNQGTRAFKALVGYESVYRWYVGNAIDSMIEDRVMYAELRPMLLDKTMPSDDGTRQLDHRDQMKIICEEVAKKKAELEAKGEIDSFPFGLKIIYCTPRSIPADRMERELADCLALKLRFPDLVCGFDLVGAEDRPNCIFFYRDQLLAFQQTCRTMGVTIPFMFHAGETLLDTGGSHDPDNSNLYDALEFDARRIGHGYALLKHPTLVQLYKDRNICLELCPISNELLHLCGNARQHPFPQLLAAGLHCTLNADNPSLFRSSLSHEFHQVLVGDPRMTLHGWKQLAEWSIEHSCLAPEEIKRAKGIHAREWERFVEWIVASYGEFAEGLGKDL